MRFLPEWGPNANAAFPEAGILIPAWSDWLSQTTPAGTNTEDPSQLALSLGPSETSSLPVPDGDSTQMTLCDDRA